MKKILYLNNEYICTLVTENTLKEKNSNYWSELSFYGKSPVNKFILKTEGRKWKIIWPNREGELLSVSEVYGKIKNLANTGGLSISYPSTASCRTLIFLEENGTGFIFMAPPCLQGRVTEFSINSEKQNSASISISGSNTTWYTFTFISMEDLENKISSLQASVPWTRLPYVDTNAAWQVQVGLIGPDGKTDVPQTRGFDILTDISELMLRELGKNNILHVFGYSFGHDTKYPDYTPSENLGGKDGLAKAIKNIRKNYQRVVFYLNGRIAQEENVRKEGLSDSVIRNRNGKPITEVYHNRKFCIMNPSSKEWQNRLLDEAVKLKNLGADGIQLDQLGGRAAPVPAGEIWGKGYINLIDNLHDEGLSVWIQGLSDIYPADWFELTYRDINILEDGTIRGGMPFGEPDKRLFQLTVPGQVLLIPLSKLQDSGESKNKNIIIDLDLNKGELFLYTPRYMAQLEKLIHRAVLN